MSRFSEWCLGLEAALAEPFPVAVHQNKGSKGTFVSVRHYVARLNATVGVGGWSMPAVESFHSGNKLGLAVGVTILGVTKWNVGDEMEDHGEPDEDGKIRDYGSSSTNSWAQGFKRCLAYGFGLGLYMYDKDATRAILAGQPTRESAPRQPREEQPATDKQVAFLSRLMKSHVFGDAARLTVQGEIEAGISKSRAMRLIDEAQKRIAEAGDSQESRADYDDNNDADGELGF